MVVQRVRILHLLALGRAYAEQQGGRDHAVIFRRAHVVRGDGPPCGGNRRVGVLILGGLDQRGADRERYVIRARDGRGVGFGLGLAEREGPNLSQSSHVSSPFNAALFELG